MTILERLSPNHSARPAGAAINCIVLHSTAGNYPGDLQWLTGTKSQVSAHYLIAPDGLTFRLVPEERRAWHAGFSVLNGQADVNDFSIGIELSYPANGQPRAVQLDALHELCADIIKRRDIKRERVVTHRRISPGRKTDPHGWSDSAIAAWIGTLYALSVPLPAPPVDAWARWGRQYPLPAEQRGWGIPQMWLLHTERLGECRSIERALDDFTVAQSFQGGVIVYERLTARAQVAWRNQEIG